MSGTIEAYHGGIVNNVWVGIPGHRHGHTAFVTSVRPRRLPDGRNY